MDVTQKRSGAEPGPLDLRQASTENWERKEFPVADHGSHEGIPIIIRRSVWNAIYEHGRSRTDVEVCGVLVGNGYRANNMPYVHVEAIIQGSHAESRLAQVTFTGETWNHIHSVMDQQFPDKRIIGWYHTHPGFGIFLSPMDMFIHENFFSAPEQLAIVYDPLNGTEGLFIWREGQAVPGRFLVEEHVAPLIEVSAHPPENEAPLVVGSKRFVAEAATATSGWAWVRWGGVLTVLALIAIAWLQWPWLVAKSRDWELWDVRPRSFDVSPERESDLPEPPSNADGRESAKASTEPIPKPESSADTEPSSNAEASSNTGPSPNNESKPGSEANSGTEADPSARPSSSPKSSPDANPAEPSDEQQG